MQRTTIIAYLIWSLLIIVCLTYLSSSLRVVSDVTQFMPADHSDKNVQLLLSELQSGKTAKLLIIQIKGANSNKLATLSRQLKVEFDKSSSFGLVHNGQRTLRAEDFINGEYKQLYQYRYLPS